MGSAPWKDAYVDRLLDEFDGEYVTVKMPNGEVVGRLMGDGAQGATRCLIVNTAPEALREQWKAAPDAAARKALDLFSYDEWIPLVRGLDVNGVVA